MPLATDHHHVGAPAAAVMQEQAVVGRERRHQQALVERGEHRLAHGVALARIGKRDLESAVGTGASDEHGMP